MSEDCFGFYVIGYEEKVSWGSGWYYDQTLFGKRADIEISFEEFLLKIKNCWFKRLLARIFRRTKIGIFKPICGNCEYAPYYFVWCSKHKKYFVSYLHSYDEDVVCEDCEVERRTQKFNI